MSGFPLFKRRRAPVFLGSFLFALFWSMALADQSRAGPSEAKLYEQAVAARQAEDFDKAVALLERIVRANPENADAQVLLGFSYLALGETQEAAAAFDAALRTAPDYQDARFGQALIAFREGDRDRASELVDIVLSAQPENQDAIALREKLDLPPPPKWRLDMSGEFHTLTGGRANWYEAITTLSYTFDQGTTLAGTVRFANRGALTDTQLTGRIDHVFSPQLSGFGLVAVTPDADFIADLSLAFGTRVVVWEGKDSLGPLVLNASLNGDFGATAVTTFKIGPEFRFFDNTLSLSTQWLQSVSDSGATAGGVLARLDAALSDRLGGYAGYSYAPEIDGSAVIETQSLFTGLSFDVNDTLTLRAGAAYEYRAAYERTALSFGLTSRF
jgi:YaiO family outer membrane protein